MLTLKIEQQRRQAANEFAQEEQRYHSLGSIIYRQASLENEGESVLQWKKEGSRRGRSEQTFIGGKRV